MKILPLLENTQEDTDMISENMERRVKDMLNHPTNPLSPEELLKLAETQPQIYGKFRKLARKMIHDKKAGRKSRNRATVDHEYATGL